VLLVAASLLGAARDASADEKAKDDKKACSEAYEQTQTLRRDGKLSAARAPAIVCARDVCAEFIRVDCAKWFGEIEASQPTIVFHVLDGTGAETSAVRVSLDGASWLGALDGKAKPVDPGHHVLRFEIAGAPPRDEPIEVREGEKDRAVSVSFQPAPAPAAVPEAPRSAPEAPRQDGAAGSAAPWIVGGVGVAGLVVGAVAGGIVLHDKSVASGDCNETAHTCSPAGASAATAGKGLGPVSTAGFVVGGVGVAVGAVWLVLRRPSPPAQAARPTPPAASLAIGPVLGAGGGGLRLRGAF